MVIQGVTYLSDFEAKKAIMEMARRLEAKGWLVAGDGSMSVRVGPQAVWVTVAGADKAALTQDMLVRVDMNGKAMLSAIPVACPNPGTLIINRSGSRNRSVLANVRKARVISSF